MNIYITGIAGFLGSHLAEQHLLAGHQVRGCDNLRNGYRANVPEGATLRLLSCQQQEALRKDMRGSDVVYHCAATAYEGLSLFSPALITDNVFQASVSVFSAAIAAGVRRIVFCSSMARYGQQAVPFHEEMPCLPVDPYGCAKASAEQILKMLADTHGVEYVVAVPHNIYGPRQKYDDPYRNVVAIMLNLALQGKQPIVYGDGTQQRCFSFIADVLPPLLKMADAPVVGEVINIGPDEGAVTINELVDMVGIATGRQLSPVYLPDRPREVQTAFCSADKARALLGYTTHYSLLEGIAETAEWIRRRGIRPFDYHLPIEIEHGVPATWKEKLL